MVFEAVTHTSPKEVDGGRGKFSKTLYRGGLLAVSTEAENHLLVSVGVLHFKFSQS